MNQYSLLKNGVQVDIISAKNLQMAIRLVGIFTDKGVYTEYKPSGVTEGKPSFCEVKHDNVYDIFEIET